MRDYFEYLPLGPRETAWTFCISAIGRATIRPGDPYPPPRHPEDHAFTWDRGRVLSALQMVAIREGEGQLELGRENWRIVRGAIFLLPPGVWHRYRPDPRRGWVEDWIELRGLTVDAWLSAGLLTPGPTDMLRNDAVWKGIDRLHDLCLSHRPGYRAIAAGVGMTILASVVAGSTRAGDPGNAAATVRAAGRLLTEGLDVKTVARQLGLSYPTLFRHFKKVTGLGPKEYSGEIRLARAENLLAGSELSIKEIAARLGYFSASHFSLEFRRGRGISPAFWRAKLDTKTPVAVRERLSSNSNTGSPALPFADENDS